MITKYNKFNESIKNLLVGPTKEEVWKSKGYDRTFDTPEEFFLNVIDGMEIKKQSAYPYSVIWEKDGVIIFEQKLYTKDLWVDYKSIWSVFEIFFGLKYNEIQIIIINIVREHLNWKGFTPKICWTLDSFLSL